MSLQPLLSSHWETQSDKSSYNDIILPPSHPGAVLIRHWCRFVLPYLHMLLMQVKAVVKLGQTVWMSCNKWQRPFSQHFCWHVRQGNRSKFRRTSIQLKGQGAIPSTTIIELSFETSLFPSYLLVLPLIIYFMKFSSAQAGSFLFTFTQLTWMLLKTSLTANMIYSHVTRWELHVDERAVHDRSMHSTFKCEEMTAHRLFFSHFLSFKAISAAQLLTPHTDHSCSILWAKGVDDTSM